MKHQMCHSLLKDAGRVKMGQIVASHHRAYRFVVVEMAVGEGVGFAHVMQ